MSDLEEPPAKVLKIDNIDGITHVTELDEMPKAEEASIDDQQLIDEESGDIEGSADGQEPDNHEPDSHEPDSHDPNGQEPDIQEKDIQEPDRLETNGQEADGQETNGQEPDGQETNSQEPDSQETNVQEADAQEEWLSEGILTDDDFNPGSQENAGDQTDSQIGTSQEEDHLDTTLDSETSNAELEAHATAMDTSVAKTEDKDESNSIVNELAKNGLDTEPNIEESQTYTQDSLLDMETEANAIGSEENISENVTNDIKSNTLNATETEAKAEELNIEETMKHLDGNKDDDTKTDVFDVQMKENTDVKSDTENAKPELKEEQDDGNDTDDLLRMLEADDSKSKKKLTKTVKDIRLAAKSGNTEGLSTDDDDFVYEGAAVKKLKVAKNALAKKEPAIKAEPEGLDDGDDETDASDVEGENEKDSLQDIFGLTNQKIIPKRKQPPRAASSPRVRFKVEPQAKSLSKAVENSAKQVRSQSIPMRQYQNTRRLGSKTNLTPKPTLTSKSTTQIKATNTKITPSKLTPSSKTTPASKLTPTSKATPTSKSKQTPKSTASLRVTSAPKSTSTRTSKPTVTCHQKPALESLPIVRLTDIIVPDIKKEPKSDDSFILPEVTTPAPFKSSIVKENKKSFRLKLDSKEVDEIINGDDFLDDDDDFDLDEDEFAESDEGEATEVKQRIMRPEMMDEEMPSDADSNSEETSLYDELPSSDSEDIDDWFALDIRAEKAGEYIPLLGDKAKEFLLEEKQRVTMQLQTLKQNLSELTDSGKRQAEQLRTATMSLAELDDMLKAA